MEIVPNTWVSTIKGASPMIEKVLFLSLLVHMSLNKSTYSVSIPSFMQIPSSVSVSMEKKSTVELTFMSLDLSMTTVTATMNLVPLMSGLNILT